MPVVIDADRMSRTLTRIAHEILERNRELGELALVGIRTRSSSPHDITKNRTGSDPRR